MSCLAETTLLLADTGSRGFDSSAQDIQIGAILFQGWQIHPVTAVPADYSAHDVYVVKINADLTLSPTVAAPPWIEFGFEFDDGGVFVADLVPRRVNTTEPARRYAVTRSLAFTPETDPAAGLAQPERTIMNNLPLPILEPTIQALGIGSPSVRWRYRSAGGVSVGSHTGWLILLVPTGLCEVQVRAVAEYAFPSYADMGFEPRGKPSRFTVRLPIGSGSTTRAGSDPVRLGFAVDIVGYSDRLAAQQREAQGRLKLLMHEAMAAAEVPSNEVVIQPTGDGMNIILPLDVVTFPRIMTETGDRLRADNNKHSDRIRIRVAADVGPVGPGELGFSGPTVVRFCRLVDSNQLREFAERNPEADVVVAISDWIYENSVRPGYSGLDEHSFTRELVVKKGYQAPAWLWTSAGSTQLRSLEKSNNHLT